MPIIDWSSKRIKIDPGADIQEIIEALQKDLDSKVTAAVLNAALAAEKAERVEGDEEVLENSKLILTEEDPESGTHNGYILTQGNRLVGHIHTPSIIKDAYLEKDGDITYLVLEFAGAVEPVKIDVTELIDLYKGSKGEMIEITIDANNTISATIIDGSITRAKVAEDIETSLQKADSAAEYTDEQVAIEKTARVAADADLQSQVTAEVAARTTGDADLQAAIEVEAEERANKDSELEGAITSEVERATGKEEEIATNLASEITRATGREDGLQAAIESEQSRAIAKETELEEAIAQEVIDRESGDSKEKEARIAEIARVDVAIAQEKADREAKEAEIEASIENEANDRSEADSALETAYKAADEQIIADYKEADEAVKAWVDEKGYATVAYVDAIDITKADKSELNSKIAEEVASREAGDQTTITAAKAYTDEKIVEVESKIPSLDGYATEEWVEGKGYLTEHQSLEEYRKAADQDAIDATKADKATTYTKSEVDELIEGAGQVKDVKVNSESVVDEDGVAVIAVKTINGSSIVGEGNLEVGGVTPEEKALIDTIPSKASKEEVEAVKSLIPSLDGYATEEWVESKNYLTEHQSLEAYRTATEQNAIDDTKATKTEVATIGDVANTTKALLNKEIDAREGLSEFVGDTPLTTSAQTISSAINELKAGSSVEEWTLDEIKEIFG